MQVSVLGICASDVYSKHMTISQILGTTDGMEMTFDPELFEWNK